MTVGDLFGEEPESPKPAETIKAMSVEEALRLGREVTRASAADGVQLTGPPPYGYYRHDGKLEHHLFEAGVVRLMFASYLAKGASIRSVVKKLSDLGFPAPRSKTWTAQTVAYVLRNEFYAGRVTFGKLTSKGRHLPLVSRADFQAVQKRLANNVRNKRSKKA